MGFVVFSHSKSYYIFGVVDGEGCGRLLRLKWRDTNNKWSVSSIMNTHNKWRSRGHSNRDKVWVTRTQDQDYPPISNSTIPLTPYKKFPVQEPIVRVDNQIYELLSIFIDRLTRLEHYVYNTLERLQIGKYKEYNLPSAKSLWSQIQQRKASEFRKESSVSSDPIRVRPKNRKGYNRDDPIESPGEPRTIDITQCHYYSS